MKRTYFVVCINTQVSIVIFNVGKTFLTQLQYYYAPNVVCGVQQYTNIPKFIIYIYCISTPKSPYYVFCDASRSFSFSGIFRQIPYNSLRALLVEFLIFTGVSPRP